MDGAGPARGRRAFPADSLPAKRLWVPLAIGGLVLIVDQATKALIRGWIGPGADNHRVDLAGRLVAFAYVQNPGAAFGILRGQTAFLILAAAAIVALLLVSLRGANQFSPLMYAGLGLLLGGALGNLVDRIRLGYVTDFVAVGIWPKFNIADSAITIGLVLMAWSYLVHEGARQQGSTTPVEGRDQPSA